MENPEVVVLEPAVLGLVEHLRRTGLSVQPGEVRTKISRGVARGWGTTSTKSFSDQHGAGWLIDLSEQFNEEMLYAVVRSIGGGTRQIVAVVEGDDIEALQREKKALPSVEGAYGADVVAMAESISPTPSVGQVTSNPAKPADGFAAKATSPSDPVLVLVLADSTRADYRGASAPPENIIRTTQGEVKTVVGQLLQDGIRPEQVEIWSGLRKPKVQIAFE